ncbi:MAG: hypothetical protein ACK4ZJ_17485, partial [Allorhizobium sp.]
MRLRTLHDQQLLILRHNARTMRVQLRLKATISLKARRWPTALASHLRLNGCRDGTRGLWLV